MPISEPEISSVGRKQRWHNGCNMRRMLEQGSSSSSRRWLVTVATSDCIDAPLDVTRRPVTVAAAAVVHDDRLVNARHVRCTRYLYVCRCTCTDCLRWTTDKRSAFSGHFTRVSPTDCVSGGRRWLIITGNLVCPPDQLRRQICRRGWTGVESACVGTCSPVTWQQLRPDYCGSVSAPQPPRCRLVSHAASLSRHLRKYDIACSVYCLHYVLPLIMMMMTTTTTTMMMAATTLVNQRAAHWMWSSAGSPATEAFSMMSYINPAN